MVETSIKTILCSKCGNPMPELRLTKFGYDFCVNCSAEKPKIGKITTMGEGDHTWNEIQIIDQETARRLKELESIRTPIDDLDYEREDTDEVIENLQKTVKTYLQSGDEEEEIEEEDEDEDLEEEEELDVVPDIYYPEEED